MSNPDDNDSTTDSADEVAGINEVFDHEKNCTECGESLVNGFCVNPYCEESDDEDEDEEDLDEKLDA